MVWQQMSLATWCNCSHSCPQGTRDRQRANFAFASSESAKLDSLYASTSMSGLTFSFDSGRPGLSAFSQAPTTPERPTSVPAGPAAFSNTLTGVNMSPNMDFVSQGQPSAALSPPPLISSLAVDRLAQDMELDERDRKRLHAFVTVSLKLIGAHEN